MSDGTALEAAASAGGYEIAKLLIEAGADVDKFAGSWGTALQAASRNGYDAIIRLLIQRGANVNLAHGDNTALSLAVTHGERHVVEQLLKAGARCNITAQSPSAFLVAVIKGDSQTAEWLVEAGAKINVEWLTLDMLAKLIGFTVADRLLQVGHNVSEVLHRDRTALEAAAFLRDSRMIPLLLKAEGEVNHLSEWYCQSKNYSGCIRRLLEAGAEGSDLTENDSEAVYSDALHIATTVEAYETILLLLEAGAKVDKRSYHDDPLYMNRLSSTPEQVVERLELQLQKTKISFGTKRVNPTVAQT